MPHSVPARRPTTGQLAILVSLTALSAIAILWPQPEPAIAAGGGSLPDHVPPTAAAVAASPGAPSDPPLVREEATESDAGTAPGPSFEECVDHLVAIGVRTAQLARDDEVEAAQASDREAREGFDALMRRFADAGERALAMLAEQAEAPEGHAARRRFVLQLVLGAECARRHELAAAASDWSRSEALVRSLLDVMPQAESLAVLGGRVLVGQPYLRAAHEPTVLGLVELAGERLFDVQLATRLLLTLWDNLQRSGQRTSEELAYLAMLLLDGADAAKRAAACCALIADPRYRPMVLAWLRERRDPSLATQVANHAATELTPPEALRVLRELSPVVQRTPGAYLVLGARAPELLADAYRELLASNTQPGVRTDLVAGAGIGLHEHGREVVELALHNDPSPDVRIQAAFVLTTSVSADDGERALQQLLDDPAIAHHPQRLDAIVLALQNLEAAQAVNAVDRLGQRLRTMPLSDTGRQSLEALLARCLPGGAPSAR
jgi:hypothetical protein